MNQQSSSATGHVTANPGRRLALEVLHQIEHKNAYAELALNAAFHKQTLKEADKALATELVNGVLKWKIRLDWIINFFLDKNRQEIPAAVRDALRLALYQILHLDRIPAFAAVNESVNIVKASQGRQWGGLVNAVLRNYLRNPESVTWPDLAPEPVLAVMLATSHPKWLVQRWLERYGVEATLELGLANNRIPEVFFRVNPLKINSAEFEHHLKDQGIVFKKFEVPGFYKSSALPALETLALYQEGYLSIQDASAGLAVALLQPQAGMTIIDLCAAPGGKSTRMAELMGDQGQIFSVDRKSNRLGLVRKTCQRLGITQMHLIVANAANVALAPADAVLADVPCSGLGVLAKKPDLKWRRTPDDITALSQVQAQILAHAASLVKPGGHLVYSTCTIEPEENEQVVEKFLAENKQFKIEPAGAFVNQFFVDANGFINTLPHRHSLDGSFAARLKKME